MRIWMPITPHDVSTLAQTGSLPGGRAFAVTPRWAALIGETDEEILEDYRAQSIDAQVLLVAEVEEPAMDYETGEVFNTGAISTRQIRAFLAKRELTDEDYSWFGPSEGLNLLEFLA